MTIQDRNVHFAIQNANPEFASQYSTNPEFVPTLIFDGNRSCEIYLPKQKYRGQLATYNYRTFQLITEPFPMVIEIHYYPDRNPSTSSHKHVSDDDYYKWLEVLNTYFNHRRLYFNQI